MRGCSYKGPVGQRKPTLLLETLRAETLHLEMLYFLMSCTNAVLDNGVLGGTPKAQDSTLPCAKHLPDKRVPDAPDKHP